MVESTDRVELRIPGWAEPIGYCRSFKVNHDTWVAGIHWEKIETPELFFNQTAAVLVTQGMRLQEFFPPNACFTIDSGCTILRLGPFILLKGKLSTPVDLPLRLKDVVLAGVLEYPKDMAKNDVLGRLLQAVQ